jgi:7,8-didemethyl-8-hydroxy-5-deazariboflavin synthase
MSTDFSEKKYITYSPSFTLPVTHSCANQCLYCGFRKLDGGLMGLEEIDCWLIRAKEMKCSEVLIISGERVNEVPSVQGAIQRLGFKNFTEYVETVCQRILSHGLLPHTNIGSMELGEMTVLREVNASMGLMLENADPLWGQKVHPQKNIEKRMETIKNAGRLKIPFTAGILVGLGEPRKSRYESLDWIADVNREFGHIQEVILQNYVPNPQSTLPVFHLLLEDWEDMISFCKNKMPGVKIQIPPNLNSLWIHLVLCGANDLGGISEENDFVNPNSPWEKIVVYEESLQTRGIHLIPRLPIYREFYKKGWCSDGVKAVLSGWVNRHEFQYYLR